MKTGILFDLDGTLWDSAEGVVLSWNRELERMGRKERVDVPRLQSLMGKTMADIACALFPEEAPEEAVRLLSFCTDAENAYLAEHGGVLYEGLEESLQALRAKGLFLAVVSNCQAGYIEAFLKAHRLEKYFDDTENYGRTGRPKSDNIRLVVQRNGLEKTWYLGDTRGDYDAAREAGVLFLHAAYGFGTVPEGTPRITDIREIKDYPL